MVSSSIYIYFPLWSCYQDFRGEVEFHGGGYPAVTSWLCQPEFILYLNRVDVRFPKKNPPTGVFFGFLCQYFRTAQFLHGVNSTVECDLQPQRNDSIDVSCPSDFGVLKRFDVGNARLRSNRWAPRMRESTENFCANGGKRKQYIQPHSFDLDVLEAFFRVLGVLFELSVMLIDYSLFPYIRRKR